MTSTAALANDPWRIVSVQFLAEPKFAQIRYEVINFTVSALADKVHRPTMREQVLYTDGVAQYKYETAIIPSYPSADEDLADSIGDALRREGLISDNRSVKVS